MGSGEKKDVSEFIHVVSEPQESNYHRPEPGGRYAARLIDVSGAGGVTYLTCSL